MPKSGIKNPAMIVMEITLLKGPLHHSHVAGAVQLLASAKSILLASL